MLHPKGYNSPVVLKYFPYTIKFTYPQVLCLCYFTLKLCTILSYSKQMHDAVEVFLHTPTIGEVRQKVCERKCLPTKTIRKSDDHVCRLDTSLYICDERESSVVLGVILNASLTTGLSRQFISD